MAPFVKKTNCPVCGSKDNLAVYADGSYFCFTPNCTHRKSSDEYKAENEDKPKVRSSALVADKPFVKETKLKEGITPEKAEEIKEFTDFDATGFRGITKETNKFFGVRYGYDDQGQIEEIYYPITRDNELAGYKVRQIPKAFSAIGATGNDCDLFGAFRFRSGGKYCVPMSTKALTRRGWLGYDEITTEDFVLGYDIKTNTKKWTKVLEKHKRTDLEVFEFGSGKQKLASTANHRWLVSQKTSGTDKKDVYFKTEYRTLEDINTASGIIVNCKTDENISTGVDTLSPNKYNFDWFQHILNMTQEQRSTFLDGVLLSDGCYTKHGWVTCQNDGALFEAILLASYLVHDKIVRVKKTKPNHRGNVMKHIALSNAQTKTRLKETMTSVGVQDTWCITTELDSWVIRQGDFITITGNCLIVEGEHDALAAYQMFKDYSESKGSTFVTAVVSITTGAGNPTKQLQGNYDFLNSFENIIVGFDNDEAGQGAVEKIVNCLPKGKVKLAKWTKYKDPNDYLKNNDAQRFLNDFYNAKPFIPAGVVASSDLYQKILDQAAVQKVPFPPFLTKLQEMLGGGLILGHIYNIAAMTSIGKTAIVNELIYYWIFNSPHMVGVVSMELNAGQYGETILSRHMQLKLARLSVEEKQEQLASDIVKRKGKEVFEKEDGTPRFYLVDDRDGTVEQIQEVIEQMVIGSGVKIVVIDPLQDLIEGMSNEDQALFMKWCKSMIKSHGISFVLINHMRKKTDGGTNSLQVSEDDIMGSSTIMKSGSANILLARDKMHEDEIERNTTHISLPKNRVFGETGPAGKVYYEKYTHVMHDYEQYWATHPRPTKEVPAEAF